MKNSKLRILFFVLFLICFSISVYLFFTSQNSNKHKPNIGIFLPGVYWVIFAISKKKIPLAILLLLSVTIIYILSNRFF